MTRLQTILLGAVALLGGCGKEPPPRSVNEFAENPMLLEAAMVRCSQNRSESRYDAECINARQAVSRIQAKEEAEQQKALEKRSERKRNTLRRTQAAAAEARRRAAEAQRKLREAEYLSQFGVLPPTEGESGDTLDQGNVPVVDIREPAVDDTLGRQGREALPARDGGNAPVAESAPEPVPEPIPERVPEPVPEPAPETSTETTDLESIRDELRRRNTENVN